MLSLGKGCKIYTKDPNEEANIENFEIKRDNELEDTDSLYITVPEEGRNIIPEKKTPPKSFKKKLPQRKLKEKNIQRYLTKKTRLLIRYLVRQSLFYANLALHTLRQFCCFLHLSVYYYHILSPFTICVITLFVTLCALLCFRCCQIKKFQHKLCFQQRKR